MIGHPGMKAVRRIEDPLTYRGAAVDEDAEADHQRGGRRILPARRDALLLSKLPAVKRLRMLPNSRHSTAGHRHHQEHVLLLRRGAARPPDARLFLACARGRGAGGASRGRRRSRSTLWQGTNPDARDFRVDTHRRRRLHRDAAHAASATGHGWARSIRRPRGSPPISSSWSSPARATIRSSSPPRSTSLPDVLPYAWEDARPITAPDR